MVLGRRSFLRSLATAVVGVGIAPKIFLAQTEVILPKFPIILIDPLMPPGRIDFIHASMRKMDHLNYLSTLKEPHGY